jgi:hypothetical protein
LKFVLDVYILNFAVLLAHPGLDVGVSSLDFGKFLNLLGFLGFFEILISDVDV